MGLPGARQYELQRSRGEPIACVSLFPSTGIIPEKERRDQLRKLGCYAAVSRTL
jgi:hypothetical protein